MAVIAAMTIASVLASAEPSRAQTRRVDVTVTGPASCPTSASVAARVAAYLRDVEPSVALPEIEARLVLRSEGAAIVGTLTMIEAGSATERELHDALCATVADAAALVIALALVPGLEVPSVDASAETSGSGLDPAGATARDADAAQVVGEGDREGHSDASDADTAATPRAQIAASIRIGARGSVGLLSRIAAGAELAVAVRGAAWRVELALGALPPVAARFTSDAAFGGDLAAATAALRGCGVFGVDRLELLGCAGVDVGAVFGSGFGVSAPANSAAPWLAIEGAIGLGWALHANFAVLLDVALLVPIVRPVFAVAGLGELHRPAAVGGALSLGAELRFE